MKKLVNIALAAILPLTGCATTSGNGNGHTTTAASGPAMYCWKGRLSDESGKLQCNWESSRRDACESNGFTTLEAARFSAPQPGGMCSNGQWLVMVQAK